jgi:hypothetical protein
LRSYQLLWLQWFIIPLHAGSLFFSPPDETMIRCLAGEPSQPARLPA